MSMKNFLRKTALTIFILCLWETSAFAQKVLDKKRLKYDDWPITVTANANKSSSSGEVTPNFVTRGAWDHKIITYFFQNGTNDMAGTTERDAVRQGMALWEAQARIRFLEVCNAANADIVILWGAGPHGDDFPFDGTDGTLAHCYFPPPVGNPLPGDLHFDDDETWVNAIRGDATQPIDLVTIAAHEIGHGIGLDHTNVSGQLMDEYYTQSHRFLGTDDIAGVQSLYGPPLSTSIDFISGPDLVCSTGSFGIVNLPATASVSSWSSSNTSILTINSSGIATRVGNGAVTINAVVSTACGSTTVSRQIYAGVPSSPTSMVVMMGPSPNQLCRNATTTIAIGNTNHAAHKVTQYNWSAGAWSSYFVSYEPGGSVVTQRASYNITSSAPSSQTFTTTAQNACGAGSTYSATFFAISCGGFLVSYPNPATDVLNMTFQPSNSKLPDAITLISEKSQKVVFELSSGQIESALKAEKSLSIPVKNFPRGSYFLHIWGSNGVEKVQISLE